MAKYDLKDLVNKFMYTQKKATAYWKFPDNNVMKFEVPANTNVGKLYAVIHFNNDPNTVWFSFKSDSSYISNAKKDSFFIKYSDGIFDPQAMRDQHVPTIEQRAEKMEELHEQDSESVFDKVKTLAMWGFGLAGAALAVKVYVASKDK